MHSHFTQSLEANQLLVLPIPSDKVSHDIKDPENVSNTDRNEHQLQRVLTEVGDAPCP
jgi:hypothetical protein